MPQWSPSTYLQYEQERSRPFRDLVARVAIDPYTIVDLGCGPGHLSAVLRTRWPDARIHGVDSSPPMIEQARREDAAGVTYELGDLTAWRAEAPVDLVISNAALQWVPEPLAAIAALRDSVATGGVLAFQVPDNAGEASHALLRALAREPRYAGYLAGVGGVRGFGPEACLEVLADEGWSLDLWRTTYVHLLDGEDAVYRWMAGTGARPFLQTLPDALRSRFEAEYRAALREAYPPRTYGTALPFPRTFAVARRLA